MWLHFFEVLEHDVDDGEVTRPFVIGGTTYHGAKRVEQQLIASS